ncbi:abhydrolase domain-containing protein FAM108B1-like [Tropilaelaps mercedesae]|uniref:Abhydrolase domain-containing protein FAM108B1-like n=1 Tax=Tropilaelaps mercedesae TaxID=418985 RepID=A0A1V9Y218_9ACAR|nr:abhydrolase domain-containing protein FAM108B1-like [Tropilaelaps mercedesae]
MGNSSAKDPKDTPKRLTCLTSRDSSSSSLPSTPSIKESYSFANLFYKVASIFCCPPTRSSIVRKLAFHPPIPATYCLIEDPTAEFGLRIKANRRRVMRDYPNFNACSQKADVFFVRKKDGNVLTSLRVKKPVKDKSERGKASNLVIIYSHPNAIDLGDVLPLAIDFSKTFSCDFVSYDYTGYGPNLGEPSEAELLCDGESVFQHVRTVFKVKLSQIVLFGESIGSVPSVYLATRYKVRGLILQGAIASGIKVIFPFVNINPFGLDCFRNIERISNTLCPVLFVHGTNDEICDFKDAKNMYERCPSAVKPLWLLGAGHNDCADHESYEKRIRIFLTKQG